MSIPSGIYHASKHLSEEELHPAAPACPWCGCTKRKSIACLQQNPLVTLLECPECFATSASRMPTNEALADYYAAYYATGKFKTMGAKVTAGDPRRMGAHLSRWMEGRDQDQVLRVLDFGGGDGTVAAQAADMLLRRQPSVRHVEITVVDYNTIPAASPNQMIRLQHSRSLENLPTERVDFVIASAVLEHIPEARVTLDHLLSLMRPGAAFYARTPFAIPLFKMCRRLGLKTDFTFPGHLYDLGQAFWEQQFTSPPRKGAFRVLSSRPSIVETSFENDCLRTLAAYLCKFPWLVLGSKWGLVGGWEVVVERVN
jgi:SAM-dependent methyltransferase